MTGIRDALRSFGARHKPTLERIAELREAGLSRELAIEAVEEEQLATKEAAMSGGTRVAGAGKPDFSRYGPSGELAIGIHGGIPYSERDLEEAESADSVGTSAEPD